MTALTFGDRCLESLHISRLATIARTLNRKRSRESYAVNVPLRRSRHVERRELTTDLHDNFGALEQRDFRL